MDYDRSLKNLDEITAKLREWEDKGFSAAEIAEVRDDIYRRLFGFTEDELTSPLSISKKEWIKALSYDDAYSIAHRHGFDIACRFDHDGEYLPYLMYLSYFDDYGEEVLELDEEYVPPTDPTTESHGRAFRHWRPFLGMMVAKDEGLFPSTPEEIAAVELRREVHRATRKRSVDRERKPSRDAELYAVFGRTKQVREGVIEARNLKGKPSGRIVSVEIKKDRRIPPGSRPTPPKRPTRP